MVTKVRQYQRQVEAQKAQLDFATKRCSQLEEENKRLRESLELQGKMDEDPLVRQQLEALLAEKARLGKENTQLQRENEHLFELLAYSTQGNRSPSASGGGGSFEWEEEDGAAASGRGDGELEGVPEEREVSSQPAKSSPADVTPSVSGESNLNGAGPTTGRKGGQSRLSLEDADTGHVLKDGDNITTKTDGLPSKTEQLR